MLRLGIIGAMSDSIHKLLFLLSVLVVGYWLVGRSLANGRSAYTPIPNWPQLPAELVLGQVTGIAVDSQGNVFVFARGEKVWDADPFDPSVIPAPTVFHFDGQTGKMLAAWGDHRFVMPHGLTVDAEDNVWLTDVGLHQVYKFDSQGKLLLTLGEAGVAGADATHFNRPTDVAVADDGSFYVSDGYENSRVAAFAANGRYLFEWGTAGKATGQFDVPHSLAVTSDRVYVADRGNGRVQIFDRNGRFLTNWQNARQIGRPWAVRVAADGFVYLVDGGDQNRWLPDRARVLKLTTEGEVVAHFGSYGRQPGQFIWPHALAIAPDGSVYVAEVGSGRRVQKLVPTN